MSFTNNILAVENLGLSYGERRVLNGVSLTVVQGETIGLIGLNGAGKTSLIKTILGLRPPDEGSVLVFGQPSGKASARARLAFLPERFDPPWFLTGEEFLKFSLQIYKRRVDKEEVLEACRRIELDPSCLSRRVHSYSKGMRQKLGLLGVTLTQCDLLILDEPMSGLDPLARSRVKEMLLAHRQRKQTVFLSSHILADMDEICDRVAIMHEGRLRYVGPPNGVRKETGAENLEKAFLSLIEKREAA